MNQHDDHRGFRRSDGTETMVNVTERITGSTVVSQASIGKIGQVTGWVYDDIFDQGTKANRLADFRVIDLAQVQTFCIASVLKIEQSVLAPGMFIVAD
jgi:hypothetical protein